MFLSPAIDRYMQTEQALQQQSDPINAGAMKGIDAAKSSMSLTPMIKRPSPWGRMMSSTAANVRTPEPGTGRAGMLQSIAQAMGPGMQAYYNAEDQNNAIEMQLAQMQHKQMEAEQERAFRQRQLDETRRYHDLVIGEKNREQKAQEDALKEVNEANPNDVIRRPITSYTKAERGKYMSFALEKLKTKNAVESTLREAEDIAKLVSDNPHLYGSARAILTAPDSSEGIFGALKSATKNASLSKKDRHALEMLAKKQLKLVQNQILSAKGSNPTNMYKEVLMHSSPDARFLPETINAILEDIRKEYSPMLQDIHDAQELIGKGVVVVRPAYQQPAKAHQAAAQDVQQAPQMDAPFTEDDYQQALRELSGGQQ